VLHRCASARRPLVAVGLLLLAISGCYPYDRHVTLAYDVPAGSGPRFNGNEVPVVIADFLDGRPDRRVIGRLSSAVVVSSPDITADNEPGVWIADAIRKELDHERYAASTSDDPAPPGVYGIEGTVIKAFSNAAGHYTADVVFEARVKRDGQTLLVKRYSGHGDKGGMVQGAPEMMGEALSAALSHAIDPFVVDFHGIVTGGSAPAGGTTGGTPSATAP